MAVLVRWVMVHFKHNLKRYVVHSRTGPHNLPARWDWHAPSIKRTRAAELGDVQNMMCQWALQMRRLLQWCFACLWGVGNLCARP